MLTLGCVIITMGIGPATAKITHISFKTKVNSIAVSINNHTDGIKAMSIGHMATMYRTQLVHVF